MTCLLYILYILINFSIKCHILLIFIIYLASPNSYVLHQKLLNFMIVAMSIQLLSGPSPGPRDANPFIDAAMSQVTSSLIFFFIFCIDFIPTNYCSFFCSTIYRRSLQFFLLSEDCYLNIFSVPLQMQKAICILMEIHQAFWKELVLQLVDVFVAYCVLVVHVNPFLLMF